MSLAIIAGGGTLPMLVAKAQEIMPLICVYEGAAPEGLEADVSFRLETFGTLLMTLGERGVTRVCMAGGLTRPTLDPTKLDAETAPLVPLFQDALAKGDDGALKIVVELFEKTGFSVVGAHELAPQLLVEGGVYSDAWPDGQMRKTAAQAADHIAAMGPRDVGQACVATGGRIIAMEDARGTDAMLADVAPVPKTHQALLFKGPKPQQTRKVDLPTIGPATIDAAGRAGLAGVVVDAGDVLMLEPDRCTALANHHGIVLWARKGE